MASSDRSPRPAAVPLALVAIVAAGALACANRTYRAEAPRMAASEILPEVGVIVLGVAQDGGLPQIGDHCGNCQAARRDPERRARVACVGIFDRREGKAYLIDATPDLPSQWDELLAFRGAEDDGGRTAPDGIFLTHAHMGHYTGLVHLGREAFGARGVPVWGTERMLGHLERNAPWEALVRNGNIEPRRVVPGEPVVLREGLVVTPIISPHRQEYSDTVGYIVDAGRRLLYVPDTDRWSEWSPGIEEVVAGVDYALLDATFYSAAELPGRDISRIPHPLVTESMDRLQALAEARPGAIGFIHMNHTNPLLTPRSEARKAVRLRKFAVASEGRIAALSDAGGHPRDELHPEEGETGPR